jgi:succinate dehydrogenase / fumarate reductase, cytochrome b subunit
MLVFGVVVAAFIVYHLLHFTVQVVAVNLLGEDFMKLEDSKHRHDVFKMVVFAFNVPVVAAFYLAGVSALCLHLSHGWQAWLQSLGLQSEPWRRPIRHLAWAAAFVLLAGYCSVPIAILLGFGKEAIR